jgi:hypothetical protein
MICCLLISKKYRIKTELIKQKININQAVNSNRLYTLLYVVRF